MNDDKSGINESNDSDIHYNINHLHQYSLECHIIPTKEHQVGRPVPDKTHLLDVQTVLPLGTTIKRMKNSAYIKMFLLLEEINTAEDLHFF